MTTKEIIQIMKDIIGLNLEIETYENYAKATYNAEIWNYKYFNICNELESYFTELYFENNTMFFEKILPILYEGLNLWIDTKENSFNIKLGFKNKEFEHLKAELSDEDLERIAEIKIFYIKNLIAYIEKLNPTTPKTKPQLDDNSNSQLVLIFFYFFKYLGIEPRVNTDIAPIAKFLHLITGKDFSKTQSSDFYKKLSKAPNHISDKSLINDLNHIKPLFQKVELNEIVKMIDNEIDQCRTAIKETKTGKNY